MKRSLKKELLSFLERHNDGSEETLRLINELKNSLNYADINARFLCTFDMNKVLGENERNALKELLGKEKDEPFTIEDCEDISDLLAEAIENELKKHSGRIVFNED